MKEEIKTGSIKILKENGYGFIAAEGARDIFFHATNVIMPEFSQLKIGNKVNYVERQGKKGTEAFEVVII